MRPHLVDVAGHQQQARTFEGTTAAIVHRHPGLQVAALARLVQLQHIVRLPGHPLRHVRSLDVQRALPGAVRQPGQCRTIAEVCRQFRQGQAAGHVEHDLVADPEHRTAAHAEERPLHAGAVLLDPGHVAPDVLLEDPFARKQVEFVVLLEQFEAPVRAAGDQQRDRIDPGRDVTELQADVARRQVDGARLPHQGHVLVVDRHVDAAPGAGTADDGSRSVRRRCRSRRQGRQHEAQNRPFAQHPANLLKMRPPARADATLRGKVGPRSVDHGRVRE
ncbi:MAG: hypothetical protein IPH86_04680 [bacterium]|nr:hypothetical protein [bacterium]